MSVAGWIVMLVSVGSVLALITFCLKTVFSLPPVDQEHLVGPLDIDTRDTQDAD